ncbi:MAG TPA: HAMP domain-containing sensor histidine kinase [Gammaproteobacteria bacterium]|nr:HAMP domain-containing sensor histidine kinase [Gammaproteobacteria bacterium]
MMKYLDIRNSVKSYTFWLFLWIALVISYAISTRYGFKEEHWDKIICFFQLAIDVCLGLFGYLAYKSKTDLIIKRFYCLIFISIIPGLFANEVYNVLINIVGLKVISNKISLSWTIAYAAFLCMQITAWLYLYFKQNKKGESNKLITLFSYSQSAIIVLLSFLSIVMFRKTVLSEIGLTGAINSLLETVLFISISMSLARTKSKSLIYLEVGFLLLPGFNLAHRLSYSTGHSFKMFDIIWLISLITIIFGLAKSWKDNKTVEFFKPNSLHVYASAVFLAFATILLVVFIGIDLVISSVAMNTMGYSNILPENIPSILIFSYTIAFLASKLVASYMSRPLEKITKRIDYLYGSKLASNQILNKTFKIHEVDRLDKFILKTITELQTANRIKSDFLMNMSHDFRTPASGITALSRSIYKKLENPTLKKLQKLVVDSSEQLMNLLDDILDYSRLDSDQYKLNQGEFYVDALIEEIVSFVTAKIKDKNLYIKTNFTDFPLKYVGDRLMLHRVILNIVSNAIKFTHIGGITISLQKEDVDCDPYLVIRILDTGIGIDEKYHDFIFEPFNRIESAGDPCNSGIGLGLSNVYLMLKSMKGKIHLQSELGKGSLFSVSLPM